MFFGRNCLLYQVCRSIGVNYRLCQFLLNEAYTFAGFCHEDDNQMLLRWDIRVNKFIDIPTVCRAPHITKPHDLLADIATVMVDEYCYSAKGGFSRAQHKFWVDVPLSWLHVDYVARDAYAAYEIWKHIMNFKIGLRLEEDIAKQKEQKGLRRSTRKRTLELKEEVEDD